MCTQLKEQILCSALKFCNRQMPKRVAIVGAGSSGLTAVRHALLYDFDPVVFEKEGNFGGIMRYSAFTEKRTVSHNTVIHYSRHMSAFSDFPPNESSSDFMHHSEVLEYLKKYAENFQLVSHIRFNTEVVQVRRSESYNHSGVWEVEYENKDGYCLAYSNPEFCYHMTYSNPEFSYLLAYNNPEYCYHLTYKKPEHCCNLAFSNPEFCYHMTYSNPEFSYLLAYNNPEYCYHLTYKKPEHCCNLAFSNPEFCYHMTHSNPEFSYLLAYSNPEYCYNLAYSNPEFCYHMTYSTSGILL
ncbi:flavin-binding monooxygenase-like domain-containing protein [Ditylenchus destructor]|uniref:Flavin-containing monooxygenase n=1 Tax=Ditylenchus destructor TaxID=166010 RepID=A0AAD4N7W4_9BILA|nr:flavin-binding monooxygenase-like domain-containing protein [Ditylenchus destructor]